MTITITKGLAESIFSYLANRPYREVHTLITQFQKEASASEEDKSVQHELPLDPFDRYKEL